MVVGRHWCCSVHRGRFQSSSSKEDWYFVILTEVLKMIMKLNGKF